MCIETESLAYGPCKLIHFQFMHRVYCGMYIPLSDDEYQFVQKVHPARANGH